MSYAQWWHEFLALRKKEKDELERRTQLVNEVYKAAAKTLKDTLIFLLGTNIGAGKKTAEDAPQPFIPFVAYVARPEVMKDLLQRDEDELDGDDVLEDEGLTSVVDAIDSLDPGDLEPLFSGARSDDESERMKDPDYQKMLREMGIDLYDSSLGETPQDAK